MVSSVSATDAASLVERAWHRGLDVGRYKAVDDVLAHYAKDTALRRLPTPDDLADAVVFLASDRARSITGQTLDVNSGVWMA